MFQLFHLYLFITSHFSSFIYDIHFLATHLFYIYICQSCHITQICYLWYSLLAINFICIRFISVCFRVFVASFSVATFLCQYRVRCFMLYSRYMTVCLCECVSLSLKPLKVWGSSALLIPHLCPWTGDLKALSI